jgi:hypothetical protein
MLVVEVEVRDGNGAHAWYFGYSYEIAIAAVPSLSTVDGG